MAPVDGTLVLAAGGNGDSDGSGGDSKAADRVGADASTPPLVADIGDGQFKLAKSIQDKRLLGRAGV